MGALGTVAGKGAAGADQGARQREGNRSLVIEAARTFLAENIVFASVLPWVEFPRAIRTLGGGGSNPAATDRRLSPRVPPSFRLRPAPPEGR